jgi:hypothetical protein
MCLLPANSTVLDYQDGISDGTGYETVTYIDSSGNYFYRIRDEEPVALSLDVRPWPVGYGTYR